MLRVTMRFSQLILGAFAKMRKATISFVMFVCPPALKTSVSIGQIFMRFDFFFRNSVGKIQVQLKSDKNNGYHT